MQLSFCEKVFSSLQFISTELILKHKIQVIFLLSVGCLYLSVSSNSLFQLGHVSPDVVCIEKYSASQKDVIFSL